GSMVTTPLMAPTALAASMDGGNVKLAWTDNDSAAAGYNILRTSGKTVTQIATLSDPNAAAYVDTAALSGHVYSYQVQAVNGAVKSANSIATAITTPLLAPSSLTVAGATAVNVQLTWTDNDTNATGYYVLRSTDGTHFTTIATLTTATATTYTDAKVTSATSYTYEVEAYVGTIVSAASNTVNPTTPLATPTGFTATLTGAYVS